jgi:hypothetical protein
VVSPGPILRFNRTAVGMSAGMLALAVTGMAFPAVVHALHGSEGLVLAELRCRKRCRSS